MGRSCLLPPWQPWPRRREAQELGRKPALVAAVLRGAGGLTRGLLLPASLVSSQQRTVPLQPLPRPCSSQLLEAGLPGLCRWQQQLRRTFAVVEALPATPMSFTLQQHVRRACSHLARPAGGQQLRLRLGGLTVCELMAALREELPPSALEVAAALVAEMWCRPLSRAGCPRQRRREGARSRWILVQLLGGVLLTATQTFRLMSSRAARHLCQHAGRPEVAVSGGHWEFRRRPGVQVAKSQGHLPLPGDRQD